VVIEQIRLDRRTVLRVTRSGYMVGRGHFATIDQVAAALTAIGVDLADLEFDYSTPAEPPDDDPECE
jgi:hypothetical protein